MSKAPLTRELLRKLNRAVLKFAFLVKRSRDKLVKVITRVTKISEACATRSFTARAVVSPLPVT